ncbi:MAG: response regulator [Ectothiorhodospiraceae bacterium]|nr:response regulator [Ectothiorhodospiraceae bacterium]
MNVLIAEDDPTLQALHKRIMDKWAFNFDMASNGLEAVELACKNNGKYDICLMDIEMPKMNGIEATKIIRKMTSYFPIIALTANDNYQNACYQTGMDDFAVKPYFTGDLFYKINKLSVKIYHFITRPNGFGISEVMPMDKQHAEELRELADKDLRKMMLFNNPNHALIVHKNIMNKISHDFNVKGQLLTTFINRDEDKPTLCHLFKESHNLLPQTLLTEDEYAAMIASENKDLDNYPVLSLKEDTE